MNIQQAIQILKDHQQWRLGADIEHNVKDLSVAIQVVIWDYNDRVAGDKLKEIYENTCLKYQNNER